MIDEVAAMGDPERWVSELLDRGDRIMGFGHRVCGRRIRARLLSRTADELGSARVETAKALEEAALAELGRRHPERVLATNVEYWAAVVLDVAQILPSSRPRCSRAHEWPAGRRISSSRSVRPG